MFDTVERPGPLGWILRYCLQLFLSPLVIVVASFPFFALLPVIGLSGEHPWQTQYVGYAALVCLFVGPLVGWGVGRNVPSLIATGRWIGVLPLVFLFSEVFEQGLSSQTIPWLPEGFFATGDNEGLGAILGTLPASSALGYSLGMALVGTRAKWKTLNRLSSVPRVLTIMLMSFALFGMLAWVAHGFEHSRIEKWSKVQTVIDRPGLWLSTDATLVCSGPTSESGIFLRSGSLVEGLERRACGKDKLLDSDAPRPAGSWVVEKVKILDGPNVGVEGWVLAYGLQGTMEH